MKLLRLFSLFPVVVLAGLSPLSAQTPPPDLAQVTNPALCQAVNRTATAQAEAGRKFVQLDARPNDGVVWLRGSDFSSGSIELDLRGRDASGQSFVGLAFRGLDPATYD